MDALWQLPVIAGPVPWITYGIAIALLLVLLIRPITPRWLLTAVIGIAAGAFVGVSAYLIANALNAFGSPLPLEVGLWAGATLAGVGLAVASLWGTPVWRKIVAVFAIIWFLITGMIGINAFYGLNPTLGSILGIAADNPIVIPTPAPTQTNAGPLYQTWTPPAGMPAVGQQGTQVIPATVSGFDARPAGIYLPPAALVEDAPALPLVILMMGYPGNPDPSYIAAVLDQFAEQNKGLAPIVVVADQIGNGGDPACADSTAFGNAETYIKTDVVNWAKANLNIINDPKYWVIAGYSNGGGCAIKYGAQEPGTFKNILDISGEEFPGSEDPADVTAQIYGGDDAAFEAAKPVNILAANTGQYEGVTAVFTAGENDPEYVAAAATVSSAAIAAGMAVTVYTVPGAGHVVDALNGGLAEGFAVLYPVLGLSAP
ncbi:Enterochelin esterase [Microbacterium sp. cf046]|uniref:alpha/beta hydrolase n=1 Tax=Microbacterium sp. cf046 TaxID=1761803 RepID=UPI0008E77DCF|nr:alpha/beta hydrolase-fold protein [Microbacterium sp. cf046]SFS07734.1 Enterochelin esterase [Microbacterium sp. cf046]